VESWPEHNQLPEAAMSKQTSAFTRDGGKQIFYALEMAVWNDQAIFLILGNL
jgi:hypothetical protein